MSDQTAAATISSDPNAGAANIYELFMGFLTILSLIVMLIYFLLRVFYPDAPMVGVFWIADNVFCVFFMADFARSMIKSPSRKDYFFWRGALDFLGSIPALPALRIARVARLGRLVRILRARSARSLAHEFLERRAESALYLTGLLALLLLIVGSSLVLFFENGASDSNIDAGRNAYWWSFVTITTVGYGDYFPVTNGGRYVGMVLMTFGIGIFGVLTSFMSSLFLAPKKEKEPKAPAAAPEPQQLQLDIAALHRELVEIKQMLQERSSS